MSELAAPVPNLASRPHEPAHETGFWADRFAAEWQVDRTLSTMAFCLRNPQLAADERMIAVIGYEELCLRLESGEQPDAAFLRQFPDGGAALCSLIDIHKYVGGHGSFLPGLLQLPAALLDNLSEAARSDWPAPGETLAGFELLEVLGKGGSARVYLAEELALGRRKVALKVTAAATIEAHALGKLRHPNVVPVYSVGDDPRRRLTLICMPFLGRATLNDVLSRVFRTGHRPRAGQELLHALAEIESANGVGPGAENAALAVDPYLAKGSYVDAVVHLGAQLADALASTHRENICHRDLKPSNVLLDRSGRPMLLDFHLSSADGEEGRYWGGTMYYMSPEVVKPVIEGARRPPAADPRSDIYSLAVVLYEMLSGRPPFGAAANPRLTMDAMRELYARQQGPLAPLSEQNPAVEPALATLVAECLSFDIDARPATAEHVAQSLRRLAAARGRWHRRVWRHRRAWRTAQAAACLALALVGYLLAGRAPYAERQFQAARRAAAQGDYSLALAQLDSAENAGYEDDALAGLRGDVYLRSAKQAFAAADYRKARDHCTLALELEPANWRAFVLRARVHLRLGDPQAAWGDAEKADGIASTPVTAALHGDCFCYFKKWDSAIRAYIVAEADGFVSAGLYNNLAHALAKSNRREEALPWLDRALAIDDLPEAYYQRASIAVALATDKRRRLPAQAAADIETALRLLPSSDRLHFTAATIYAVSFEQAGRESDRRESHRQLLESLRSGLRPNDLPRSGPLAPIVADIVADAGYQAAIVSGATAPRVPAPGLVDSLVNMP